MATKALMLSIPNPCSENWNNMTPQEKGRFCDACQKCVVDFTAMSDAAVLDFFNKKNGKVCGRFDKQQLDRVLIINDKRFQKRFNIAASLLFLSSLGFSNSVRNEIIEPLKLQQFQFKKMVLNTQNKSSNEPFENEMITISGSVFNTKKEPMIGASVLLKGTTTGALTDSFGRFSLSFPKDFLEKGFLTVSYIGYQNEDYRLSNYKFIEPLVLEYKAKESLLGECIVYRPNLWKRFTNLFRSKNNKKY